MSKKKPVPRYRWNENLWNRQTAGFFRRWQNAWKRGEALDIEEQYDYIKRYIFYLIIEPPYENMLNDLLRLRDVYGDRIDYLLPRIVGCYMVLGRYKDAIETLQTLIKPMAIQGILIDQIWSLKLVLGLHITASEILSICGPQLTEIGLKHIDEVTEYLDFILKLYEERNNISLIEFWSKNSHSYNHYINTGARTSTLTDAGWDPPVRIETGLIFYSFSRYDSVKAFIKQITRLAENHVREGENLPYVGMGWVGETELYNLIRRAFPNLDVQFHSSPSWLGRQHLDIFIPEVSVALEYQGIQHDEPVEFFGGQMSFEANQERDARKKKLCEIHNVKLIYVRQGYDLLEVLDEIVKSSVKDIAYRLHTPTSTANSFLENDDVLGNLNHLIEAEENISFEYVLDVQYRVEPLQLDPNYIVKPRIAKKHISLSNEISNLYKQRKTMPDAIERLIGLCNQLIEISEDMAQYYYQDFLARRDWCLQAASMMQEDHPEQQQHYLELAESLLQRKMRHVGYERLISIHKKQRRFEDALQLAIIAKSQFVWGTDEHWDKIIVQLLARLD